MSLAAAAAAAAAAPTYLGPGLLNALDGFVFLHPFLGDNEDGSVVIFRRIACSSLTFFYPQASGEAAAAEK